MAINCVAGETGAGTNCPIVRAGTKARDSDTAFPLQFRDDVLLFPRLFHADQIALQSSDNSVIGEDLRKAGLLPIP